MKIKQKVVSINKGKHPERIDNLEKAVGAMVASRQQAYKNVMTCAAGLDKMRERTQEIVLVLKRKGAISEMDAKRVTDIAYVEGPYREVMLSPNLSIEGMSAKMIGGMHTEARRSDMLVKILTKRDLLKEGDVTDLVISAPTGGEVDDGSVEFLSVFGGDGKG
jgi:hypothetical protein